MAEKIRILKINESNFDDLVEHGRVEIGSSLREKMEPGRLVLVKFIKGLGDEHGNRVALYRVSNIDEEYATLEPETDFNKQLQLTGDDWERLRFVPLSLRQMHVWEWNSTNDDRGLYEMVEAGTATREQVLDRCFAVNAPTVEEAEEQVRQYTEVAPFDRFMCVGIGDETIEARILEADLEGDIGLLSTPVRNIPQEFNLSLADIEQAASSSGGVRKLWDFIREADELTEVPYDHMSFYDLLSFKKKVEQALDNGANNGPPWDSPMWQGLMEWVEEDQAFRQGRVLVEDARQRIVSLLQEDALDDLTIKDFNRDVWQLGHVVTAEGTRSAYDDWDRWSPEEIAYKLQTGEWQTVGNLKVKSSTGVWGPMLTEESEDEKTALLRSALRDLIYGPEPPYERIARAKNQRNGLNDNSISLILTMMDPSRFGFVNDYTKTRLRKLADLLRMDEEWADRIDGDYEAQNELLLEIRDHSEGLLDDLIDLDRFLLRVAPWSKENRHWKVALAMHEEEADALYNRAIAQNFAAVRGGEPDANDAAFREIWPGDYVVMHRERSIAAVGRVTRPYYEIDDTDADEIDRKWYRRIGVHWLPGRHDYGQALRGANQRRTVIDLDEGIFWWLAEKYSDDNRFEEVLYPPDDWRDRITPPELRHNDGPTLSDLARACCCSVSFIEDIIAQLNRKGQVIFFGPPGTGKTYVARQIARYLAEGDESRRELIQFHPSYTYEDFMEGIKPESLRCDDDRWEVSYPVRAGSFKRFCERASNDPENTYVFVIDEINRGQIAKVFGELMYLLEYRDDEIELAYTKSETDDRERFGIPRNVRIIGTMNTADRSIALVDFALRRRFTFIPFYPDEGDVRQMLPKWLERNAPGMGWAGRLLDQFNAQLAEAMGRDYLIGHSYFMQPGLDEDLIREIWRYQIEPLLHEYFIGTPERVRDEFGLDRLIRRAKGEAEPDGEGGEG